MDVKTVNKKTQYAKSTPQEHPSGDQRFKILDATMKRHQYQQDALIEVLHKAQELFGYLENDLLLYIVHSLKLPPSRVYGVATLFHFHRTYALYTLTIMCMANLLS